jgi:hypothetical protein
MVARLCGKSCAQQSAHCRLELVLIRFLHTGRNNAVINAKPTVRWKDRYQLAMRKDQPPCRGLLRFAPLQR